MKSLIKICFLALFIIVSCSKNNTDNGVDLTPIERRDIALTKVQEEYVQKGNAMALRLFDDILTQSDNNSFIFSPLSIEYAFTLIANGADGQTLAELLNFLDFTESDIDGLNDYFKLLFTELPKLDNTVTILSANALIGNSDFNISFLSSYVDIIRNHYDALVEAFPFNKENKKTVDYINSWANESTNGLIKSVLDKDTNLSSVYFLILNALYFSGSWNSSVSFNKNDTEPGSFTRSDGSKCSVDYMQLEKKMPVYGTPSFSAIQLPYGNGAFEMLVILPDKGYSVENIASELRDSGTINNIQFGIEYNVSLSLPKFSTKAHLTLGDIIKDYIPSSFSFESVDFSKMLERNAPITDVFQDATINVDERGTESASVTTVVSAFSGIIPPQEKNVRFNANHPFIYLIRETSTDAIIVMGVYDGK